MSRARTDATATELAILEVLWNRGPTTIRDIVAAVYQQHTPALHATVKSLLERLEEKGYVECNKSSFAHRFCAQVSREAYVGRRLEDLAASHFQGDLAPMLLALLERINLSKKDRDAIRKIIDGMK
jgi:predicted transcriptional regulator